MRVPFSTPPNVIRLLLALFVLLSLPSCETKSPSVGRSDYASNMHTDGGYNPYPTDSGGVVHNSSSLLPSNNYGRTVPPPPAGYTPPPIPSSSASTTRSVASTTPRPTPPKPSVSSSTTKKSTASTSKAKSSTTAKAAPKRSGGTHTVVSGDTLWGIARKNNTTVDKLKAANGLSSDKLKIGIKLKLP